MRYSSTTGLNLITRFKKKPLKPIRFQAKGKGTDRRGEPIYNDFTLVGLNETAGNSGFTTVVTTTGSGQTVYLRMSHNARYMVPVDAA